VASVFWIEKGLAVQPPRQKASKGKKGQKLYNRYGVQTSRGQRAALSFPDDSQLHLNQQTAIVLRTPHLTQVTRGTVDQQVEPGTTHQVQTASAVASAIGTEFEVKVTRVKKEAKGKKAKKPRKRLLVVTEVAVKEGVVDVTNAQGEVVVHAGEETTVVQGQAPSPPATVDTTRLFAWTSVIPPPDKPTGKNVVLQDNGGHVIAASSQSPDSRLTARRSAHQAVSGYAAANINDGSLATGWSSDHGKSTSQWVLLGFGKGAAYPISAVVIDPAATGSHPAANDARDFELWVSPSGTDPSSFTRVLTGTLQQAASLQRFTLDQPVLAQYVKLVLLNNYGGDAIDVAELEVVSHSNPVTPVANPTPVATASPTPTAAPTAHLYSFTNLHLQYDAVDQSGTTIATYEIDASGQLCAASPYNQPWQVHSHVAWSIVDPAARAAAQQAGSPTDYDQTSSVVWEFDPSGALGSSSAGQVPTTNGGVTSEIRYDAGPPPAVTWHVAADGLSPADQTVSAPVTIGPAC
jgi:hypothetical protein